MEALRIDDGMGGYITGALMTCCGKPISPYLKRIGVDIFTVWECRKCKRTAEQMIGCIDLEFKEIQSDVVRI